MKKIPTLFKRYHHSNNQVYAEIEQGCEWVFLGEGTPTIKWDGTCVLFEDGIMYKRYDAKKGKTPPDGFIPAQPEADPITTHWPGWLAVDQGNKADKWHVEAADEFIRHYDHPPRNGTYELCGPKINGNPEGLLNHILLRHGDHVLVPEFPSYTTPRDFYVIVAKYLADMNIEGIVWHHPDGKMCKIKRKDFGLSWPKREEYEVSCTQPVRERLDREAEQAQDSDGADKDGTPQS